MPRRHCLITTSLIAAALVPLSGSGCTTAPHLTTAPMQAYDSQTDYVAEDLSDGFILTITRRSPAWTTIPTEVALTSCHMALITIARAEGQSRGHSVTIVPDTLRIHMEDDLLMGRTLCGASAAARYTGTAP